MANTNKNKGDSDSKERGLIADFDWMYDVGAAGGPPAAYAQRPPQTVGEK